MSDSPYMKPSTNRLRISGSMRFVVFLVRKFLFGTTAAATVLWMVQPVASALDLVSKDTIWYYKKGTKEASYPDLISWRKADFKTTGWLRGKQPFFLNENSASGTELTDMRNSYSSVFFRRKFKVDNPVTLGTGDLLVKADDGFVAWINGKELARFNAPTTSLKHRLKRDYSFVESC